MYSFRFTNVVWFLTFYYYNLQRLPTNVSRQDSYWNRRQTSRIYAQSCYVEHRKSHNLKHINFYVVFFKFKQCFIWRYTGKSHFTSSSGVNKRTRRKDKLVISCSLLFNFIETSIDLLFILISLDFFFSFSEENIVWIIVKLTRLKSKRSGSNKFRNNLFA